MDKKHMLRWLSVAGVLMIAALVLRFAIGGMGILPYVLGAAALIIVFDVFHKNWAVLSGILTAGALVLRFAVRGYV